MKPPYRHTVTWRARSEREERTCVYFAPRHHADRAEVAELNTQQAVGKDVYDEHCAAGTAVIIGTPTREVHDGA